MEMTSRSLQEWNGIVDHAFNGCDVGAPEEGFLGHLAQSDIEDLRFCYIEAGRSRVERWRDLSVRSRSGHLLLHVQLAGAGHYSQSGRNIDFKAGDTIYCNPDAPYQIDFDGPYRAFVLEVPADRLAEAHLTYDVEEAGGRRMDRARSAMLGSYLTSVRDQAPYLEAQTDWREAIGRAGLDLAVSAIGEAFSLKPAAVSTRLTRAVLTHVHDNLRDPDLRTSAIAAALGINRKSVQLVFTRMSTTASAYILERRLRLAATELRSRRTQRSITETAYDVGFSDSAYFSRCFHRRFGCVPRAYPSRGNAVHFAMQPPSITSVVPVTKSDADDAR